MLNLYQSILSAILDKFEDKIIILDGWPIKELELLLESSYPIAIPQSFTSQMIDGNFDYIWFTENFKIIASKGQHILTLAQFIKLTEFITEKAVQERAIILRDDLRVYFPLNEVEYLQKLEGESIEARDVRMPKHHVEHVKVGERFFYIQSYESEIETVLIHVKPKELLANKHPGSSCIDISNIQDIEIALSDFLESGLENSIHIVSSSKYPIDSNFINRLERLFYYGFQSGLKISIRAINDLVEFDPISEESELLLDQYWGLDASFREIQIYKDPDISNELMTISQGNVVDLIIKEIKSGKAGQMPRDVFLTAPTGSGKSLLFQIPAFFNSANGDITIVVSPLIALMKDQVRAIKMERGFTKVAYINSELSYLDREQVIEDTKSGRIDVLYLSPELLLSYSIDHFIGSRRLSLLIIDEAHLITTWGRDFRIDYWFLGNHIRKIKKHEGLTFPIVAVTATAVYGGMNDMVFDTLSSLEMTNPYMFIGSVRRDDIHFVLNNTFPDEKKKFDSWKINQTVNFILGLQDQSKVKTLVYAPYRKQVSEIYYQVEKAKEGIADVYFGGLDMDAKENSYQRFVRGESRVMICTKAFGMGIDISDIQVVYHHAPSGHLPDYIQEIGRLARDKNLEGWAALNYSPQDKRYMTQLFGMSSLKQFQIRLVLEKLYQAVKREKSQNLLFSVDDFSHIFQSNNDIDQKVLTALMMIEKDYLSRFRYNVVIARPKKLFSKVFARLTKSEYQLFQRDYKGSFQEINYPLLNEKGFVIVSIDLEKLWKRYFKNENFPYLKYKFYTNKLFDNEKYDVTPQLKIEVLVDADIQYVFQRIDEVFFRIKEVISKIQNKYFTKEEFQDLLDIDHSDKIAKFLLDTYSSSSNSFLGVNDDKNNFLQRRKQGDIETYKVFSRGFESEIASLRKRLGSLFNGQTSRAVRYMTYKDSGAALVFRLGLWLESLGLGSYSAIGGENPMIFVRINDVKKIEKDLASSYENALLEKTRNKHNVSSKIFDHFFLNRFEDSTRWDFIEDFFLGVEIDDLFAKYPTSDEVNTIDLIQVLSQEIEPPNITSYDYEIVVNSVGKETNIEWCKTSTRLSIQVEDGEILSKTFSNWLKYNPVLLHQFIEKKQIKLQKEAYYALNSALKQFPDYYNRVLGIRKRIDFLGYEQPVLVSILLKDDPIKFYNWWVKNLDQVYLPMKEKLELLFKVESEGVKLIEEHLEYLQRFKR